MATQEMLVDYADEDVDDDEYQKILAVIKLRKEKKEKLKKQIHDRVEKSQKDMREAAQQSSAKFQATIDRMGSLGNQIDTISTRIHQLPPPPQDSAAHDVDDITQARKELRRSAEVSKNKAKEIEASFRKRLYHLLGCMEAERKRAHNEKVAGSLAALMTDLNNIVDEMQSLT